MKYGIKNEGLIIKCANCKKQIASDGELKTNYCDNCGAPLSVLAIADFEDYKEVVRKDMLLALKDIAVKNHTDSFLQILKKYSEENE